jgi:RNA binding exosome subunit
MSTKPPIAYIDIRVFAHATEDPAKVQTAVRNLLPEELAQTFIFEKISCTGHHGNPIILFTAKLTDKKLLPTALQKIGKGLGSLDKEELERDIKLHLEKGNLKFSQNDPIHIKIHFKNKTAQEITEFSRQAGLLP